MRRDGWLAGNGIAKLAHRIGFHDAARNRGGGSRGGNRGGWNGQAPFRDIDIRFDIDGVAQARARASSIVNYTGCRIAHFQFDAAHIDSANGVLWMGGPRAREIDATRGATRFVRTNSTRRRRRHRLSRAVHPRRFFGFASYAFACARISRVFVRRTTRALGTRRHFLDFAHGSRPLSTSVGTRSNACFKWALAALLRRDRVRQQDKQHCWRAVQTPAL